MKFRYVSTKLRTFSRFMASANASSNARFTVASVRRRMPNETRARSAADSYSSIILSSPARPSSNGKLRTIRIKKLSKVPICERCCVAITSRRSAASFGSFSALSANSVTNRSKISPAAARENVSATISCGFTSPRIRSMSRCASACVLPVPADASINMFAIISAIARLPRSQQIVRTPY